MSLTSAQKNVLVKIIGSVTLGMGGALTITPRRSAGALGLPYSPHSTSILGCADVLLGAALLSGRQTRRWMHVRALANVGLAALYAVHLRSSPSNIRRTWIGFVMMLVISMTDGALARALPSPEAGPK